MSALTLDQSAAAVDLSVTAVHEAGHACVGAALGLIPEYATVRPDATCRGHVKYERTSWHRTDMYDHAAINLAGVTAARRVFGAGFDSMGDWDVMCARLFLSRPEGLSDSEFVTRALARAQQRTDRLLTGRWPWVMRTAEALERWRVLSGDEILRLRQ